MDVLSRRHAWKTETPMAVMLVRDDTAFVVLAVIIAPMFLTAGILMIRRPARMYRRFWIWSDEPPLKFDLVCCQIMGWIFTLGMTAWSIAFVSALIELATTRWQAGSRRNPVDRPALRTPRGLEPRTLSS